MKLFWYLMINDYFASKRTWPLTQSSQIMKARWLHAYGVPPSADGIRNTGYRPTFSYRLARLMPRFPAPSWVKLCRCWDITSCMFWYILDLTAEVDFYLEHIARRVNWLMVSSFFVFNQNWNWIVYSYIEM